ncbi:hypothetical protein AAY473_040491 [Plecturocebus cupreus]
MFTSGMQKTFQSPALLPMLECSGQIMAHETSASWVQVILLPQPPE